MWHALVTISYSAFTECKSDGQMAWAINNQHWMWYSLSAWKTPTSYWFVYRIQLDVSIDSMAIRVPGLEKFSSMTGMCRCHNLDRVEVEWVTLLILMQWHQRKLVVSTNRRFVFSDANRQSALCLSHVKRGTLGTVHTVNDTVPFECWAVVCKSRELVS